MKPIDRTRSFAIRADSIDEKARTVRARFFTDAPVPMPDYEGYRVIDEVLLPSGAIIPDHVPMFDSHDREDGSHAVMGSVEAMVADATGGDCTLRFCSHPDPTSREERLWTKVRERHIRSVSVGYRVHAAAPDVPPGETRTIAGREWTAGSRVLRIATSWEVKEVSPCAIPADSGAKIRARALISWRLRMDKNLAALNAAVEAQVSESKTAEAVIAAVAATAGLDPAKVTAALAGDEMLSVEDMAALAAALGVAIEAEPAKAPEPVAEPMKSEPAPAAAPARADEMGIERRAREAKAAAEFVMAFAPQALRAEAETMLLRGVAPEVIRARLLALQAERMKPVGTPEPAKAAPKADDKAVSVEDFGRTFFAGFGTAATK